MVCQSQCERLRQAVQHNLNTSMCYLKLYTHVENHKDYPKSNDVNGNNYDGVDGKLQITSEISIPLKKFIEIKSIAVEDCNITIGSRCKTAFVALLDAWVYWFEKGGLAMQFALEWLVALENSYVKYDLIESVKVSLIYNFFLLLFLLPLYSLGSDPLVHCIIIFIITSNIRHISQEYYYYYNYYYYYYK